MPSKIVLVTGANSGVGYSAAKVIVNHSDDFHVIMTGRSLEKVQKAMSEIEKSGTKGTLSTLQLDVTDQASINKAVEAVEKAHGHLDVLINNAGVANRDPDLKTRLTVCLTVNTIGAALVSEAFRPLLFRSTNPYSIHVSSGAGSFDRTLNRPEPHKFAFGGAYRVSKAAQNMLAIREHLDFGAQGLKVFAMSPGCVVSNLRGTAEDERNAWGIAGDPDVAGDTLLRIALGERDADVGKFVSKDGLYPW